MKISIVAVPACLVTAVIVSPALSQTPKGVTPVKNSSRIERPADLRLLNARTEGYMGREAVKARMAAAMENPKKVFAPAMGVRQRIYEEKTEKLDSIVAYTFSTGDPLSLQEFEYDASRLPVRRVNSLWDPDKKAWYPVEIYGFEWDKDFYCLSNYVFSDFYNYGERYDFTYNDRKLGDSQIISSYADGVWTPYNKGEYVYDDADNIVEETIYCYENGAWVPMTHSKATYDEYGHQTFFQSDYWDGTQWVPDGYKSTYKWTPNGLLTECHTWEWDPMAGKWGEYRLVEQKFNDSNLITLQEDRWWNKELQSWAGCQDGLQNKRTDFYYDELGRKVKELAKFGYTTDGYTDACEDVYTYTPKEDGVTCCYRATYMYDDSGSDKFLCGTLETERDKAGNVLFQTESKTYDWTATDPVWYRITDEYYTYDGNENMLKAKFYVYDQEDGNERHAYITEEYVYDKHNNIIDSFYANGVGEDEWEPATRFTYRFECDTVRVEKLGFIWDGTEYQPNWGEGVRFDFSIPVEKILLWPTGEPSYHKAVENRQYMANGTEWDYQSFNFHYSGFGSSAVGSVMPDDIRLRSNMVTDNIEVVSDRETLLRLYSLNGMLVLSSPDKTVSVSHLPAGIYIADISGYRTKIVKK